MYAAWSAIALEKLRGVIASIAPFGSPSLTARILLMQVVWMLVIFVLVIASIWFTTNLVIENSVRHQGKDWIAKLDEMGMPIYATDKPGRLKRALGYLRNFPEVAQAAYLDASGKKIIAEYARNNRLTGGFSRLTRADIKSLERTDVDEKPLLYDSGDNSLLRITAPIWIKSISRDGLIDFSLDRKPRERVHTIGFIQVVIDYSKTMSDLNRNILYASFPNSHTKI